MRSDTRRQADGFRRILFPRSGPHERGGTRLPDVPGAGHIFSHDDSYDAGRSHVRASLAGRGRRRISVPRAGGRRAGFEEAGCLHAPRRGRGSPRRDLGGAPEGPRPRSTAVPPDRACAPPGVARTSLRPGLSPPASVARRRARGEGLPRPASADAEWRARRGRGSAARARVGRARERARGNQREERGAVAPHVVRRISAERRVRIQRRPDSELRAGGRCHRRDGSVAAPGGRRRGSRWAHCRRAIHGLERIPRREE